MLVKTTLFFKFKICFFKAQTMTLSKDTRKAVLSSLSTGTLYTVKLTPQYEHIKDKAVVKQISTGGLYN